jgi:PKD repeat protein
MARAKYTSLIALAVLMTACTIDQTEIPDLTGPSEYGLSVGVTATPDILLQDGVSRSTIAVSARDANGQPLPGVSFRLDTLVGFAPTDFGTLSSRTITTGSDGIARATYTPPLASPFFFGTPATRVSVQATRIGSDFQAAVAQHADIVAVPPPVPTVVPGAPIACVTFAPASPKVGDLMTFDASCSQPGSGHTIVSYFWSFGDNTANDEHGVDASHTYLASGTYTMVLGVIDEAGQTGSTFRTIVVTP